MPTVFVFSGFRFMFYSNDHLPIHIHVIKDSRKAKFNINPVELIENKGLKPAELKFAQNIIEENKEVIAEHWNSFFNNKK